MSNDRRRVAFHARLADIEPAAWDALRPDDNPFLSHAFLAGLETHGCILPELGWQPHHLTLHDGERLVGAAPVYLKGNSHGEFVFDWSWAEAYARYGLDYYPKLLCAVPYSPVCGPRLLGDGTAAALLDALRDECAGHDLSSAHVNFAASGEPVPADPEFWLERNDWQFHWHNDGYRDFDDFLAALQPKKRKNLRQERARVAAAGIELQTLHGDELDDADWRFVHACYARTFQDKGNYPALTEAFLRHLGAVMPRQLVVVIAREHGERVAMALCLRSATTLYGRYWGSLREIPGLHFETCYYQGIAYCLRAGLSRFEPGAQGQHKIARGFLPQRTRSFHHIVRPEFRAAIRRALRAEQAEVERRGAWLRDQSPFAVPPRTGTEAS
ncbi:MAG TPA: GNAT family N-acetyltransferase [Tahibacter sp.]|uniref:GNAT family N-acetyltransferase n=1 Tax=Tahibacter sp. TaxID=2056211 RepID=UPI002D1687CF|nr:GNAT family N-acetyltransferase [Tahibacter sp.]HSX62467.1 GNAT family N-acetyltransferase [Tahibacter sp.]